MRKVTGFGRSLRIGLGAPLLMVLSGCSLPQEEVKTRQWTEDVLLDGGSTILVKRSVSFRETNSWSGDAYNSVESAATLAFTGDLAALPKWEAPLIALLLYRDEATNEWVIVATTASCDRWNGFGAPRVLYLPDKPSTIYWEYRLGEQGWRQVPISRTSIGRPVNLFYRYEQDSLAEHVTVDERKLRQSGSDIIRTFVAIQEQPEVNCMLTTANRNRRAALDKRAAREAAEATSESAGK